MTIEQTVSFISIAASIAAVVISIWAARTGRKASTNELRLSRRTELHSMLINLEKEMLHDGRLAAIYNSNANLLQTTDKMELAKIEQYVRMHFGLFELLHSEFRLLTRLDDEEKEISDAWHRFIQDFFRQSDLARRVWKQEADVYYRSFREYVDGLIAEVEAKGASTLEGNVVAIAS